MIGCSYIYTESNKPACRCLEGNVNFADLVIDLLVPVATRVSGLYAASRLTGTLKQSESLSHCFRWPLRKQEQTTRQHANLRAGKHANPLGNLSSPSLLFLYPSCAMSRVDSDDKLLVLAQEQLGNLSEYQVRLVLALFAGVKANEPSMPFAERASPARRLPSRTWQPPLSCPRRQKRT